jgi:PST family polysaccharide transporter
VYNKIDIFLLGTISTKDQVGYYNAAYRIMEASFLIPLVITNTVFPRLSMTWIKDKLSFRKDFFKYVSILVISGILVAVLLALLSNLIIPLLYGDKFLPSVNLLFMLAFAVFFIYPGYLVTQSLVILGKSTYYFALTIFATCLNIMINLYLIPRYGALGASFATIITEAAVTLTGGIIIFKTMRNKNN